MTLLKDTNVKASNRSLCFYLQSLCFRWNLFRSLCSATSQTQRVTGSLRTQKKTVSSPSIPYLLPHLEHPHTLNIRVMIYQRELYQWRWCSCQWQSSFSIWHHHSLSDILQGRSICRALWDYYKISGKSVAFFALAINRSMKCGSHQSIPRAHWGLWDSKWRGEFDSWK